MEKKDFFRAFRAFHVLLLGVAASGALFNLIRLARHFYLWPLVRLIGYGALLIYVLLMPKQARYNNRLYEP